MKRKVGVSIRNDAVNTEAGDYLTNFFLNLSYTWLWRRQAHCYSFMFQLHSR